MALVGDSEFLGNLTTGGSGKIGNLGVDEFRVGNSDQNIVAPPELGLEPSQFGHPLDVTLNGNECCSKRPGCQERLSGISHFDFQNFVKGKDSKQNERIIRQAINEIQPPFVLDEVRVRHNGLFQDERLEAPQPPESPQQKDGPSKDLRQSFTLGEHEAQTFHKRLANVKGSHKQEQSPWRLWFPRKW
eukprot:CAMPEP_0116156290 /NCGR_PEP_ID=MMETSP0329-20121206/22755_1 /TAXON_ID=697910 /ORGANISM="Pseudo-nitzschia arenysensis, Strain B593" /LENGTH=187 /DNA_ID=CAMNT_0003653367 /DNA_START=224 /DNA_END=783 /DNA_ORIENTATION=-